MRGSQSPHEVDRSHDQGRGSVAPPFNSHSERTLHPDTTPSVGLISRSFGSRSIPLFTHLPPCLLDSSHRHRNCHGGRGQ